MFTSHIIQSVSLRKTRNLHVPVNYHHGNCLRPRRLAPHHAPHAFPVVFKSWLCPKCLADRPSSLSCASTSSGVFL